MTLCSVCEGLGPLAEYDMGQPYHTLRSLQSSAAGSGCELCRLIWEAFKDDDATQRIFKGEDPEAAPETAQVTPEYCSPDKVGRAARIQYQSILVHSSASSRHPAASLELFVDAGDDEGPDVDGRSLASSHEADSTFRFVRETSRVCSNSHVNCPSNTDVVLPTFVIDVGSDRDTSVPPQLVENDGSQRGTYLSLSYCWGGPQAAQLTTKTVEAYKTELPLSSLHQTLQDAVIVTRRLGHRYLWIDALCIVQDDDVFKQKELVKMGSIYGNSFLTIQASVPSAASEGFLAQRRPPDVPLAKLLYKTDAEGRRTYVYARLKNDEPRATAASERAWLFQEAVLPVRVAFYTELQVIVACRKRISREDGMPHGALDIGPLRYAATIRPDLGPKRLSGSEAVREAALAAWYWDVAVFYSKRTQSVGVDRLNALAAYAEEAQRAIARDYLAGLWDGDLVRGLAWRRIRKPPLVRAAVYRAPSWSWASYDGAVWYDPAPSAARVRAMERHAATGPDPHFRPRIIEAWVTKAGISPFGSCRDGRIVLETLLGLATSTATPWKLRAVKLRAVGGGWQLKTVDGGQDVCIGWFDTDEDMGKTVFCASLTGISGLLLVRSSASSEGRKEFRRIGTFKCGQCCDMTEFATWRRTCQLETITLV